MGKIWTTMGLKSKNYGNRLTKLYREELQRLSKDPSLFERKAKVNKRRSDMITQNYKDLVEKIGDFHQEEPVPFISRQNKADCSKLEKPQFDEFVKSDPNWTLDDLENIILHDPEASPIKKIEDNTNLGNKLETAKKELI